MTNAQNMPPTPIEVMRTVSDEEARLASYDPLDTHDAAAREEFVDIIRREAHGVIWPSVTVTHDRWAHGMTIRVRGIAFPFRS